MELDTFLIEKRWEILQILARKPSSPIEIAEKLNTTVSYVSQQLKLLDAAGLLKKEKTGLVERGKPRSVFSISNEFAYITILTNDISEKKLIHLTQYHKAILKIWLLEDSSIHYPIEKLFWKLDDYIDEIDGIFVERSFVPRVLIVSGSGEVKKKVDSFVKKLDKGVNFSFIQKSVLSKLSEESIISLYDPSKIFRKEDKSEKEESGGENE